MKICIDAGHGGLHPGAIGPGGTQEKDIVLEIALELHDLLFFKKQQVVLTRATDVMVLLQDRVNFANATKCNLFISLHCNAADNPDISGMEVYTSKGNTLADDWANRFQRALLKRFQDHKDFSGPGPSEEDFFVLRKTAMPAVLIEAEFISNPDQELFLKRSIHEISECIGEEVGEGRAYR